MRKLLKFLHTIGAVLFMGAIASLLAMSIFAPPPSAVENYVAVRAAMERIATWVYFPGLFLTLVPGLLGIAVTRAFHNAGWVWVKALSGVLVFEWSLVGIVAPIQREAEFGARVLAHKADVADLGLTLGAERGTMWIMLAIAAVNVALGVWRPRLTRLPAPRTSGPLKNDIGAELVRPD